MELVECERNEKKKDERKVGSLKTFCWADIRSGKGVARAYMAGVTAASRSRTVALDPASKSRRALREAGWASKAALTDSGAETALARVATSETFSAAKENQSLTSAESLVSLARVTGVWRSEEEVATTTRSAPRISMTDLVSLSEAARSFFQTFRPEMRPREMEILVGLRAATTSSSCSGARSRSM